MVGGAVRNTLLAEPVGDVDIATTATPDEVIARVEAAGFKAVPTGIEHGTVTVVAEGRPHEVTTLARGRRDRRASRQGRVRPRLAARCGAPRLHHERALGHARRHDPRLCRRPGRSRSCGACASSASRQPASPRTICAFCGSSASMPPMGAAPPIRPAWRPAWRRASISTGLSRERVRMEMFKLLVAAMRCRCWR